MLTGNVITAEDAARFDGDADAFIRVAGTLAVDGEGLHVTGANGKRLPVYPGQWVVRFGPGDVGVMDDGEYQRWFGHR